MGCQEKSLPLAVPGSLLEKEEAVSRRLTAYFCVVAPFGRSSAPVRAGRPHFFWFDEDAKPKGAHLARPGWARQTSEIRNTLNDMNLPETF